MIEEDGDAKTGISCGTTISEGHDTGHALRPAEGQGTSVHANEPQHDGRMKPSRGKRGTKDGVVVKKTVQGGNWSTKAWEPALHARVRQVVHRGELGT